MKNMKYHYKRNNKKNGKDKEQKDKKPSSVSLQDNRIIYLNGEINDSTAKEIIEQLLKFDISDHKKTVTFLINSGGGSVSAGLAIYNVMNYVKCPIKTINIGRCASMASILLINGTKGLRYCLPSSETMIHEVASGTFGKITQMQEELQHTKVLNDKLLKIIATKTNKTLSQIRKETKNKDSWMDAQMALKFGFVDKVLW